MPRWPALDQVSRWVDDFEAAGALPSRAGEDGRAMAERLRSFLAGQCRPATRPAVPSSAAAKRRLIAGMGLAPTGDGA